MPLFIIVVCVCVDVVAVFSPQKLQLHTYQPGELVGALVFVNFLLVLAAAFFVAEVRLRASGYLKD